MFQKRSFFHGIESLKEFLGNQRALISWKLDGLTIVLTYRDGALQKAVTRGNGEVGEVITNNAKVFKNVPLSIAYQGELVIKDYEVEKTEEAKRRVIGSFNILNKEEMGLIEISLNIDGVEEIFYYTIQNEAGTDLISEDRKEPITDSFTYLKFLSTELGNLKIQCYNKEKTLKYEAYFDDLKYEIYILEE
mgnify:CR=1 FL=1